MPDIDYDRFIRVLSRCIEVAAETTAPPILTQVYKISAQVPVKAFLDASAAVDAAISVFATHNRASRNALIELDAPYRVARSATLAVLKTTKVPDTLKSQPTDTDTLNAIQKMVDIITKHTGEPWADTLLAGDFSAKSEAAIAKLSTAIVSNKALTTAQAARARAYDPAHEGYLAFKRVVRDALGPASKQYRRIHLRASPGERAKPSTPSAAASPAATDASAATATATPATATPATATPVTATPATVTPATAMPATVTPATATPPSASTPAA